MMNHLTPAEWNELSPYVILSVGTLLLLLFIAVGLKAQRSRVLVSTFTSIVVLAGLGSLFRIGEIKEPFNGLLVHDALGISFGAVVLGLLLISIPVVSMGTEKIRTRSGGVFSLLLLSAMGGVLMVFANHLLVFLIGLELLSLPLYVLSALGPKSVESSEAAFKYFLLGAIASAFFVFGSALLWGSLGTLQISQMPIAFAVKGVASSGLLIIGATLVTAGIAFKIGLVPFQMWVPDVYQGAPATVVAWMSGAVKASTFAVALRLFGRALPSTTFDWTIVLTWIAMASMVWGSFAALYQTNVKRMLAYSSVAHAGYATIVLVCSSAGAGVQADAALVFYVLVYGLASMAGFFVISLEEEQGRTEVKDLAGLAKRRPAVAFALAVALLSLAGLPPLGGFVGKFNVFVLAVAQRRYELVMVGVVTSVVSLAYYLRILVSAYMVEPSDYRPVQRTFGAGAAICISSLVIIFLGILPGGLFDFLLQVGR